jgi:elongation factor G
MDRAGADFFEVLADMKAKLGSANAIPHCKYNIGNEDNFRGVVDLITNQAIIWNEERQGNDFQSY